jgi:hypothetical protein
LSNFGTVYVAQHMAIQLHCAVGGSNCDELRRPVQKELRVGQLLGHMKLSRENSEIQRRYTRRVKREDERI